MRWGAVAAGMALVLLTTAVRADDAKPARVRRDRLLFYSGLLTAIGGGVAEFVGFAFYVSGPSAANDFRSGNRALGSRIMLSGLGPIGAGVPMAIVGGWKVEAAPVVTPTGAGARVGVTF